MVNKVEPLLGMVWCKGCGQTIRLLDQCTNPGSCSENGHEPCPVSLLAFKKAPVDVVNLPFDH